jgi:hypothetical protein
MTTQIHDTIEFGNGFLGTVVKTYEDGHFILECEGAYAACYRDEQNDEDGSFCLVDEEQDFTTLDEALRTVPVGSH